MVTLCTTRSVRRIGVDLVGLLDPDLEPVLLEERHEEVRPVDATDLFVPFLEEHGFEVRIEESNEVYAEEPLMRRTDLVVQSVTMSEISREAFRGLAAAVRRGTGLAGWHGGIADSYRACSDYLQLIGGQFATHPSKDPAQCVGDETDNFLPYTVHVTDLGRAHEITAGVEDFTFTTEQD